MIYQKFYFRDNVITFNEQLFRLIIVSHFHVILTIQSTNVKFFAFLQMIATNSKNQSIELFYENENHFSL